MKYGITKTAGMFVPPGLSPVAMHAPVWADRVTEELRSNRPDHTILICSGSKFHLFLNKLDYCLNM